MRLPEDPFILVSFINMKLRDRDFDSLSDLCASFDVEEEDIKRILANAGFHFNEMEKQFR